MTVVGMFVEVSVAGLSLLLRGLRRTLEPPSIQVDDVMI